MQPEHATKKEKNYGLWLPDYTILLLQSLKYIFKSWVWICLDSIFDRFCWNFRWFHKHIGWPWTLQFYFWNILDAGLEPSWFYFWNLLILFLQTPQLDDWWYWWFSLCATCGVELPWFHFCILGVSSLGALDFILFFRGSTPSGCTTRGFLIMLELAAWNVSNYFGCCMFLLRVVLPLDSWWPKITRNLPQWFVDPTMRYNQKHPNVQFMKFHAYTVYIIHIMAIMGLTENEVHLHFLAIWMGVWWNIVLNHV